MTPLHYVLDAGILITASSILFIKYLIDASRYCEMLQCIFDIVNVCENKFPNLKVQNSQFC